MKATPILHWLGGKSALIPALEKELPPSLGKSIRNYCEPFLGGAALFFHLYSTNKIDSALLVDINPDLINLYRSVQLLPAIVIAQLEEIKREYDSLSLEDKERRYYDIRQTFRNNTKNEYSSLSPKRAAQMIFLNKHCFNGLWRLNKKGLFNASWGKDHRGELGENWQHNIRAASEALGIAEIVHGDFTIIRAFCSRTPCFIYYDPPYAEITTKKESMYTANPFTATDQKRLADLFTELNQSSECLQLVSNSNHKMFDELYGQYNISRISAPRRINTKSALNADEILVSAKKDS
jgi:DNA adenine methylase